MSKEGKNVECKGVKTMKRDGGECGGVRVCYIDSIVNVYSTRGGG